MIYSARACAKINLFLDVGASDASGYHTVDNVMQTVSLFDTVTLSTDTEGISSDNFGEDDICFKAAKLYAEMSDGKINAHIRVKKQIPVSAGLGGGSADAAAVLIMLEKAYGELGFSGLYGIAERLGADVPFFLTGGTAYCGHYGERIFRLDGIPDIGIVIAVAGEKGSTGSMYKKLDGMAKHLHGDAEAMLSAISTCDMPSVIANMFNSFETVCEREKTDAVKGIMKRCGADAAMLSGSGQSVFGIFTGKGAEDSVKELSRLGYPVFLCKPSEKAVYLD